VTGHKIGGADEIRTADGILAEAEMGCGDSSCFFGVIDKISLGIEISGFTNNFDGVLVGTNSSIGSKTIKHSPVHAFRFAVETVINLQT